MKKIFWPILIIAILALVYFVFIPTFAGSLSISPSLQLGPLVFRWYGLILAAAILVGYLCSRKHAWRFGISPEVVDDFAFWITLVGIVGARIYYVIFNLEYFSRNWAEVYKIWHGGLSIYGAILAGILFTYFYTRRKAFGFWQMSDLIVLSLPLAQAVGRLGNFVNQEAFGTPTDLPWKMYIEPMHRPAEFRNFDYFHPAFLYEALANLIIFVILYRLVGKFKSGTISLAYLMLYSFFRFFIEAIRVDSFIIQGFRIDQVVAFAIFLVAGIVVLAKHHRIDSKA